MAAPSPAAEVSCTARRSEKAGGFSEGTGRIGPRCQPWKLLRDWGLNMETDTRTDLTFQAPLHTNRMSRPDNMSCPGQPMLRECIRAGQEAWQRLSSGQTRQDWLLVGKACQLLRIEAMRTAHTNRPEGRRYSQEFSDLLKANGFDAIDKSTRSRLFCILDNIADVEKWLATVPANKRLDA